MQSSFNQILDRKIFLTIICLSFFVFILSSDAHRFTFDEDVNQLQSLWLATMTPDPKFVLGESRMLFQYPDYFPNNQRPICEIGVLCSQVPIGFAVTQAPFILINIAFDFITPSTVIFTDEDFPDPHYVYWRNSLLPNFTFLELFYGPFFAALSVGVFYLISRTYLFSPKVSTILSILFAFTTTLWAYSQTSLNAVTITFFILFGFFFFRKFIISLSSRYLLMSGIVFGFAFLVRKDAILFIIPLFFYCIFILLKNYNKIKNFKIIQNFLLFIVPMISSWIIHVQIGIMRGLQSDVATSAPASFGASSQFAYWNVFGMLFAPGVGVLIFAPILFTMFLSFFDFFKKNKTECLLLVSFLVAFLMFYSQADTWHGLNGWGDRYLLAVVPFLLLPLGFSIQKRLNKTFYLILIGLGFTGVIFNISYLVTDVSWFIWGIMGSGKGLYELGHVATTLWIHPLVLWTFEFSQLTHALRYALVSLHPDIFLLKVWGIYFYSIFSTISIGLLTFYLIHLNKKSINNVKKL